MRVFLISLMWAVISSAILIFGTSMLISPVVFELAKDTKLGYPDFGTNGLNWIIFSNLFVMLAIFPTFYFVWNIFVLKYLERKLLLGDVKFGIRKRLNLILLMIEAIILLLIYYSDGFYSVVPKTWLMIVFSILIVGHISNEILFQIQKRKFGPNHAGGNNGTAKADENNSK